VAFFTDSYLEANGVARTATALEAFAARRDRPLLVVHGGSTTQLIESGAVVRLELARSPRCSFPLEHDLRYDVALWRHTRRVARVLRWFRPDVLHFTGPSDVGQIGMALGRRQAVPMVGSWHTNLHEYASRRLLNHLPRLSDGARLRLRYAVERHTLSMTTMFYRLPRVLLAPNEEWQRVLKARTGKPTFVMTRGIDGDLFTPRRRRRNDASVNVGYVGRLSIEKNVRALADLYDAVRAAGRRDVRFTIVGDGAERAWLRERMPEAVFTGVLRGEALADAYADLDLFAFPSETETVGNVVIEAMASGVPVVAMGRGGQRFVASSPASATLAYSDREFVETAMVLIADTARRQTMGIAARECALKRSWSSVFDGVYRAYGLAIAGARTPARQSDGTLVPVAEELSA